MSGISGLASKLSMDVRSGMSNKQSSLEAVQELKEQLTQPDLALAVIFLSPNYNLDEIGPLLKDAFSGCY